MNTIFIKNNQQEAFLPNETDNTKTLKTIENILVLLWGCYIFLKQFYFWKSGLPQTADILFPFIFVSYLLFFKKLYWNSAIACLAIFFGYACSVNIFFFIVYRDTLFLNSNLYFLYNFAMVLFVNAMCTKFGKNFTNVTLFSLSAIIITQLLFATIFSQYLHHVKFSGTMTNPNQFGLLIIFSISIIFLICNNYKSLAFKHYFILCVIFTTGLYLIDRSGSRASALGILIFWVVWMAYFITLKKYKIVILFLIIPICFIAVLFGTGNNNKRTLRDKAVVTDEFKKEKSQKNLVNNIERVSSNNKIQTNINDSKTDSNINKSQTDNNVNESKTNNIELAKIVFLKWCYIHLLKRGDNDRILLHPQYLILGSGEGNYKRFSKSEFHSLLGTIIFSYGIVGLFFFILFWKKTGAFKIKFLIFILPIIVHSIFHNDIRQPFLWMIFILINYFSMKETQNKSPVNNNPNIE
jgi:hypothetical protein